MTFETVFIEQCVRNHPVTEGILSRLPTVNWCIVEGRTWQKRIKNEMVDSGLAQDRMEMSGQAYEDHVVSALAPRFPEKAVRFVAQVGASKDGVKAGMLERGEACAFAKKHLFLTYTDPQTLVKSFP